MNTHGPKRMTFVPTKSVIAEHDPVVGLVATKPMVIAPITSRFRKFTIHSIQSIQSNPCNP
jgi:hypothetical protein